MSDSKKYIERLKKLNEDAEKKTVLESIDRPIRNLIYHMNRIGLRTRFSCCGFNYEDEEEPKSHDIVTYIQFYEPPEELYKIFFRFVKDAGTNGWAIRYFGAGLWILNRDNPIPNEYKKDDGMINAIHDYEHQVISITGLERTIINYPTYKSPFTIVDGNKGAKEKMPEWQVKPKLDIEITYEDEK